MTINEEQINPKDIQNLKRLAGILDGNQMTSQEFLAAFEQVVQIIINIESRIIDTNSLTRNTLTNSFDSFKNDSSKNFDSFKQTIQNSINVVTKGLTDRVSQLESLQENTVETQKTIDLLKETIPTVEDIMDYLPQAGIDIRNALELLQGDERLDWTAIKGLEEKLQKEIALAYATGKKVTFSGAGATRGFFVFVNGVKKGIIQNIDFVAGDNMNLVFSEVNGRPTLTFNVIGSGTWMEPETPLGAIDGSNVTYYLSYVPQTFSGILFVESQYYNEGVDWTITDNIITMTTAIVPLDASLPPLTFIFKGQFFAAVPIVIPTESTLLIEDGSDLLLEDGASILLES